MPRLPDARVHQRRRPRVGSSREASSRSSALNPMNLNGKPIPAILHIHNRIHTAIRNTALVRYAVNPSSIRSYRAAKPSARPEYLSGEWGGRALMQQVDAAHETRRVDAVP